MRFLNIYTFFNPFNYIHANFYVSSSHFQMLLLNYFQISRSFLNVTLKRLFDDPTISHPIETTEITRRVTVLGRKGHHSTWPWAPFGPTQGIQRTQERTWSMSFRLFLRDFHSLSLSLEKRQSVVFTIRRITIAEAPRIFLSLFSSHESSTDHHGKIGCRR